MAVNGYIIDYEANRLRPSTIVDGLDSIKFLYYDDINNSVDAAYDEQNVRGRSDTHIFYSHTGPDTYSFSLHLAASVDQADGGNAQIMHNQYLFMKSFEFPDYGMGNKGPVKPPHKAIIRIGKWFNKIGVIQSPSGVFSKTNDGDGYPMFIDVTFTFRVVTAQIRSLWDVRAGI